VKRTRRGNLALEMNRTGAKRKWAEPAGPVTPKRGRRPRTNPGEHVALSQPRKKKRRTQTAHGQSENLTSKEFFKSEKRVEVKQRRETRKDFERATKRSDGRAGKAPQVWRKSRLKAQLTSLPWDSEAEQGYSFREG